MRVARVVGQFISTIKDAGLDGSPLLIVENAAPGEPERTTGEDAYVAVDLVGAGHGELVLIVTGSAARRHPRTEGVVVDCAVVGIADSLIVNGEETFNKSGAPV